MPTNYPTSLDAYARPVSGASRAASPTESVSFDNAFDAIEALEAKVGVNSSAVTSSLDYKVNTRYNCSVTSAQSASFTAVTFTKVNFDTIVREDGPASFSLATDLFTAPYAGWYHFDAGAGQQSGITNRFHCDLYVNGAAIRRSDDGAGYGAHVSASLYLALNDTVGLYAWCENTVTQNNDATVNYLDIAYLRA